MQTRHSLPFPPAYRPRARARAQVVLVVDASKCKGLIVSRGDLRRDKEHRGGGRGAAATCSQVASPDNDLNPGRI